MKMMGFDGNGLDAEEEQEVLVRRRVKASRETMEAEVKERRPGSRSRPAIHDFEPGSCAHRKCERWCTLGVNEMYCICVDTSKLR